MFPKAMDLLLSYNQWFAGNDGLYSGDPLDLRALGDVWFLVGLHVCPY